MSEESRPATPPGPPKPEPADRLRPEPQPAGDEEAPLDPEGLVKEGRQGEAVAALELAGGEDAVASFIERRPWDRRSEALLEKATARFPTNPKILSDRAQYCLLQNRVEEALDVLGQLLEAEPRSTSDRATRARVLRTLGRLDEADRVLGNTPPDLRTDPEIVQERVELLLDHGRPRDAVAELEASEGEAAVANFIARRSWDDHTEALLAAGLARFPDNTEVLEKGVEYYVEKIRYYHALEDPPPGDILAGAPEPIRRNREVAAEYAEFLAGHDPEGAVAELARSGGEALVSSFVGARGWDGATEALDRAALAQFGGDAMLEADLSGYREAVKRDRRERRKERRVFQRSLARQERRLRRWRRRLGIARAAGGALRWYRDGGGRGLVRVFSLVVAIVASVALEQWLIFLGYLLLLLVLSGWRARTRVVIQDFADNRATPAAAGEDGGKAPAVGGSAALLAGRLFQMRDRIRAAQEWGETATSIGKEEATGLAVQLEDVGDLMRGAVAADAQVEVGPLKVPAGAVMALVGGLVQGPRLRGSLRGDAKHLVLSAQLSLHGRDYAWRVERDVPAGDDNGSGEDAPDDARAPESVIDSIVEELGYRVFTDVVLGEQHQWEATRDVAEGLEEFVSCLTTPQSGKLQLNRVERRLTEALAKDSTFVLAYHNLGVIHMRLADLEGWGTPRHNQHMLAAVAAFRRTIQEEPAGWQGRYALATVLRLQARLADGEVTPRLKRQVVEQCERALQLGPPRASAAQALNLKSLEESDAGDLKAAIASREEACRLIVRAVAGATLGRDVTPGNLQRLSGQAAQCLLNLAVAYAYGTDPSWEPGNWLARRRAATDFRRLCMLLDLAISLSDRDAGAHFEYGRIAERWGELDVARRELETAARIEPDRPRPWAQLASVCATAGRQAAALTACSRAEDALDPWRRDPETEEARQLLLEAYRLLGRFDLADRLRETQRLQQWAEEVMETGVDPDSMKELRDRVNESSLSGEWPWGTARQAFVLGWLELPSQPAQAVFDLDVALKNLGEHHPDVRRWQLHCLRARAMAASGNMAGALAEAEVARGLDPLSARVWEVLADLHEKGGDYDHAREAWRRALLRRPDDADLHRGLGICCWKLAGSSGDVDVVRAAREEAADHLDAALKLTPGESLTDQRWTHYVLARLDSDRDRFDDAVAHLLFVDASCGETNAPLRVLTDLLVGEARMKLGGFVEAEAHLYQAIRAGEQLLAGGDPAATISTDCGEAVGDPWNLGLVLAWAHCTMAESHARRRGNLQRAAHHVTQAQAFGDRVRDELHQDDVADMIDASCSGARGRILLGEGNTDLAIEALRRSVAIRADSEVYLVLAWAYERAAATASRKRAREGAIEEAYAACASVKEMELDGRVLEAAKLVERRLDSLNGSGGSETKTDDGGRFSHPAPGAEATAPAGGSADAGSETP